MHVAIYNTQKRFPIDVSCIESVVKEVIRAEERLCHEVAVHFVGRQKICSLHAEYFDDPSVTDCISFPIDNDEETSYIVLGEVFVCPGTADQYVKAHGGILNEEIILYCVHGILHLLGYDDIEEADRQVMREREQFHMQNLRRRKLLP
ncbi:MAG: rRNA maturation RNase YbeY [Parachlamydiaceae bacterium]